MKLQIQLGLKQVSLSCEMNFWVKGPLYIHFKPAISTMYNQIKRQRES